MKKDFKRPVKVRKRWPRNPKTKIEESAKAYARQREKREAKEHEIETWDT